VLAAAGCRCSLVDRQDVLSRHVTGMLMAAMAGKYITRAGQAVLCHCGLFAGFLGVQGLPSSLWVPDCAVDSASMRVVVWWQGTHMHSSAATTRSALHLP
jgi:hypothetical protein